MDNILLLSHSRFSVKASPTPPPDHPPNSSDLRRPKSLKPPTAAAAPAPFNPLKNLCKTNNQSHSLSPKLRLSSKLSPPPPPPLPTSPPPIPSPAPPPISQITEFRQEGKIFVGNLPNWIKKHEVSEFFRQFGPIKNVILIKDHNSTHKNAGFGFILYEVEKSAEKAVEFDGVEFHGRILTVKLDDGKRLKTKAEKRGRWIADGVDEHEQEVFRSNWHREREKDRKDFRRVLETHPENWQAVVTAFERIKKLHCSSLLVLRLRPNKCKPLFTF